jgi:hypothetical protein
MSDSLMRFTKPARYLPGRQLSYDMPHSQTLSAYPRLEHLYAG